MQKTALKTTEWNARVDSKDGNGYVQRGNTNWSSRR